MRFPAGESLQDLVARTADAVRFAREVHGGDGETVSPGRGYFSLGGSAHRIQLPVRPLGIPGRVSDMVAKRLLSSVALARARAGPATTLPVVEGPEE